MSSLTIEVSKRRPDGSQAKVVLEAVIREATTADLKETAELLLLAEMHGNSQGDVRVNISGLEES